MHAMMRGMIKVAVVTAASQCHSACMHFVVAHVLVTCAQAMPRGLLQPTKTEELYTAAVTWHFNAHAQDAFACVDYGFGDISMHMHRMRMRVLIKGVVSTAPSYIFILYIISYRNVCHQVSPVAAGSSEDDERGADKNADNAKVDNICSIVSKHAGGGNRQHPYSHIPISISSYLPICTHPGGRSFGIARCENTYRGCGRCGDDRSRERLLGLRSESGDSSTPCVFTCLHREYMCKQRW